MTICRDDTLDDGSYFAQVWAAVFRSLAIPAGRAGAGLLAVLSRFMPGDLLTLSLDCARVPLGGIAIQ